ncbi:acyltransferase family protein [Parafrigoribacterium soli]|uniref:acyltransferase family protein n=1 Tax=Parafrigoribacterium soli TaxID=3144663 RepID=UPI0032EEBAB9
MTDGVKTAPARKKRVAVWDNARFAAVTLVVVGHGIQRLTGDSDAALGVYLFIYAFHMPAFAIISGYFSKASPPNSRQMKKVLTDIVLPYAIMEAIWSAVQFLVEGSTSLNPTTPHWTLWFLLALGLFRLLLPYLVLLRWPLVWCVVFSIGVGYLSNIDNTFSLSRTIGILPFFFLGWQVRQWKLVDRWHVLDRNVLWVRSCAVAVFAIWIAVVFLFIGPLRSMNLKNWFFYDDSYNDIVGQTAWWAGLVRLGFILLAVLLSAAMFVLIPRRRTWFTSFGQATMYIYLLHSFVLYPIRQSGILGDDHSSSVWLLSMILACIAISIALASPLVRKVFRPLIEPKPQWLFLTLEGEGGSGRPAERGPSRVDPTGSRRDR